MTTLATLEVEVLRKQHPELPDDYFDYLLKIGWGETESGLMIHSSPLTPESVFGERYAASRIVLLGDDMQGYCFGFDKDSKRLGEISDFGDWENWPDGKTFSDYVRNE